ncbi:MAG: DNA gyrase inhibitor YacG [Gammaproteobacteria bacterium]|nr:DNA gyrase inhibitor YacG [Gammaproteobacteria bacterium]
MTETTPRILACPTCGNFVKWTRKNEHRPFCSDRCKLIDLGAWADEQYTLPEQQVYDDRYLGSE